MNKLLFSILGKKLKSVVVWGLAAGGCITALWGVQNAYCYGAGFLTGCFNFILSAMFMDLILKRKPKKSAQIQGLFFVIRYFLDVLVAEEITTGESISIILFVTGFLTVNYTVIISSYKRKGVLGREW